MDADTAAQKRADHYSGEPPRRISVGINPDGFKPGSASLSHMSCPDERCGNHGEMITPVSLGDGTPRCPVCHATGIWVQTP